MSRIKINWELKIYDIISMSLAAVAAIYSILSYYTPPRFVMGPIDRVVIWADITDGDVPIVRFAASTNYLNQSTSDKIAIIRYEFAVLQIIGKTYFYESQLEASVDYLKNVKECKDSPATKFGEITTVSTDTKIIGCHSNSAEKIKLFRVQPLQRIFSGGGGGYRYSMFEPARNRCQIPQLKCESEAISYYEWSRFVQDLVSINNYKDKTPEISLMFGVTLTDGRTIRSNCTLKVDDVLNFSLTEHGFAIFDTC